jgi:hypothetical protein
MTEVVVQPTVITVVPDAAVIGSGSRVAVTLGQVAVVGVAQGPPGPPGPPGPQGPSGAAGSSFVFDQAIASATWTISHPLNKHPAVHIEDSSSRLVIGDVEYPDNSTVIARFSAPFGGKAYLN